MDDRFPFPAYPNGWFRAAYTHELAIGDVRAAALLRARSRAVPRRRGRGGRARRALPASRRAPRLRRQGGGARHPLSLPRLALGPRRRLPRDSVREADPRRRADARLDARREERPGDDPPRRAAASRPPTSCRICRRSARPDWTPLEIRRWKVKSRWLDMNENAVDQVHFRFVHGTQTTPKTRGRAGRPHPALPLAHAARHAARERRGRHRHHRLRPGLPDRAPDRHRRDADGEHLDADRRGVPRTCRSPTR